MYFPTAAARLWSGGTESAGVTAPSTHWFLAEGATGGFFYTFILLSNPQDVDAHVTLQYLLDTGETVTMQKVVGAHNRLAEGRIGGPHNFHTYVLLANPQTTAAQVTVTFVRENGTPVVKHYTVPPTSRDSNNISFSGGTNATGIALTDGSIATPGGQ